jgi:hypothetical protein
VKHYRQLLPQQLDASSSPGVVSTMVIQITKQRYGDKRQGRAKRGNVGMAAQLKLRKMTGGTVGNHTHRAIRDTQRKDIPYDHRAADHTQRSYQRDDASKKYCWGATTILRHWGNSCHDAA